jgi:diguanylate cyclase (GGDEF)-like protein
MAEFLVNSDFMRILRESVIEAIRSDVYQNEEFQLERDGVAYYLEARMHKSDSDEILIMIRNMTDRITLEHRLEEMAERDALTGIYNRRVFEEKMRSLSERVVENICLLSVDVNGLKFINDTLGHLAGDRMIIAAANIIHELFIEIGLVARIGGDEFGVITEGVDVDKIECLLRRLDREVEQYKLRSAEGLSLSYGYSFHVGGAVNMELMFQEADNNMYQTKLLMKERSGAPLSTPS